MNIQHKDYMTFDIPSNWTIEEKDDATSIYNNHGEGALTMSFYTIMELDSTLVEHISGMATKFVDRNHIALDRSCFILNETQVDKKTLYGTGTTEDGWFIKIWLVSKYPKIVLATYESPQKTKEVKKIDKIIESIRFQL